MKMMSRKLAMPLLGMLLWVISIHAGTFATATATLLPRPITGLGRSIFFHQGREPRDVAGDLMKIAEKDLNRSIHFGNGVVNRMLRLETNLGWSNINVKKGSPAQGQLIVSLPEKDALSQGKDALVAAKATVHLMNIFCNKHKMNPTECAQFISSYSLLSTSLESSCSKLHKVCTSEELLSNYRSIDGSCNHRLDGSVGATYSSYKRLLTAEYLDGVQEPRRSVNKKPLPSPRLVSTSLVKNVKKKNLFTLSLMVWSDFIEHDLSHTVSNKMVHTENTIECCSSDGGNLSPRYIHPFCAPISIPFDDAYYSKHGLDCMTYVRSVTAFRSDCSFGAVDQLNQATHYLDASQVYGTTSDKLKQLRSYTGGLLKIHKHNNRNVFLPLSEKPTEHCQVDSKDSECFVGGDSRVNLHPQLTAMHTLWLREHNRVAKILSNMNNQWDDETIFQETRRIIIAEIQHITYNEWIPAILGKKYYNKIQKYTDFNENVNPSVSNSFATAAIRALNSLMDDEINLYKENRVVNMSLSLKDHFNNPGIIEEVGYLDAIVRGLATQQVQDLDFDFVEAITSQLFSNGPYGFDVFSLDIQRGRDHGLPPYTSFRTLCGLPEVKHFDDFRDLISSNTIESLRKVYNNVHDVDLIVGGMSENTDGDSLFGPTFSCIIADQFLRTKRGDRYFYTNENQPKPFSRTQIGEIGKTSLARIFCDNSDVQRMQPKAFHLIADDNAIVDCDSEDIPRPNFNYWLDSRERYSY